MNGRISQMEPVLPERTNELEDLMPKGPVRLAFPTFVAGYLFPDLYPAQIVR